MRKQKITLSVITLSLLATVLFTPVAFAQTTTTNNHPNFFQGLISFIEQKFGLNKDQVTSAVNEYKTQVKATINPRPTLTPEQIQAQEKARLDKLVAAGKITSAQETAILSELANLNSQYPLTGLTGTQRRTQMQAMQTALKTWAQAQSPSINVAYIMPVFGGFVRPRGANGGFRGHFGTKPTATPTP